MSEYKVYWGWYDGERNSELYDNEFDAYESFHECTQGDHDWARMYRIEKDGYMTLLHDYDKIVEMERHNYEWERNHV